VGTALVVLFQFYLFPNSLEPLWREDSLVEYLQSLLFLSASFAQLYIAVRLIQNHGNRRRTIFHLLLLLLFFLVAMEEISWGQRIFGWETPPFLEDNLQGETNIHNIFTGFFSPFHLALVLFINTYCYVLPLARHLSLDVRKILDRIQLPIIPIDLVSIFIIADIVRPIGLEHLDGQLTVILSLIPLGLFISRRPSRLFEILEKPALQVSCICLIGMITTLLGLFGPPIPTLWLWESRELLFGLGFMSYSLFEARFIMSR